MDATAAAAAMSILFVNSSSLSVASPIAYSPVSVGRAHRRRALGDVVLGGARATWHASARWIIGAGTALTALLIATDRHRVCEAWGHCDADDWGPAHSLLADHGAAPFVMLALVAALQLGGLRRGMWTGVLTALGATVMALGVAGKLAFTHFLSNVDGGNGAVGFALLVTLASCAQIILEVVLAVGERKALEARDPSVPRAAVVR